VPTGSNSSPLRMMLLLCPPLLVVAQGCGDPRGRLLRPQAMVQEEALRAFGTTLAYRMDLAAARGSDPGAREAERARFRDALGSLLAHQGPSSWSPTPGRPMVK